VASHASGGGGRVGAVAGACPCADGRGLKLAQIRVRSDRKSAIGARANSRTNGRTPLPRTRHCAHTAARRSSARDFARRTTDSRHGRRQHKYSSQSLDTQAMHNSGRSRLTIAFRSCCRSRPQCRGGSNRWKL
jgi:hypothetical protein